MKVLKSSLIVLLLSLSLCACSNKDNNVNITSEVLQTVKSAAAQEEMPKVAKSILTNEAYEQLKSELSFLENSSNITIDLGYSGVGYNSLNKAFYDVTIDGTIPSGNGTAELFFFTGKDGKVNDIKAWWKELN